MERTISCSAGYFLRENWAKEPTAIDGECLYVIGGLYGNLYAAEEIHAMARREAKAPAMVFNGDMHWFDCRYEDFSAVEEATEGVKLLGNVEYELSSPLNKADCGCNYPPDVDAGTVARSNQMHSMMKENLHGTNLLGTIATRPMTAAFRIMGLTVAITHGDEKSMAGWGCDRKSMKRRGRREELGAWLRANDVDILATTHTCLPAITTIGTSVVVNNGSAGMANVRGETFGLISRMGRMPHKDAVVSRKVKDLYVELVKVDFDGDAFLRHFDARWPKASPAHISYRDRIVGGTDLEIDEIDLDR